MNDISLKVTDDDLGESTSDTIVTCENVNPEVDAGLDQIVDEGTEVTIEPSFTDDGVEDTHSAVINWGDASDNTIVNLAESPMSESHVYCANSEATVTVTDDDGGIGDDTLTITVNNVAPVITSTGEPYFGLVGEIITFNATAEDVCDNTKLTYEWDFGEGYSTVNTHSWNDNFDGVVMLKVFDGTDYTEPEEVSVTIYDYQISLDEGWNLISIPLVPEDIDYREVLEDIKCDINKIWAYQYDEETGRNEWSYKKVSNSCGWSSGSLQEIKPGYGYYFHMNEDATLYANGEKYYKIGQSEIPMPPQEVLTTGWNLIGHYGLNVVNKENEIQDLSGGILTDLADVTLLSEEAHPTSWLEPTEGYWAFITGQDNLFYAPSEADYESTQTIK